MRTITTLIFLSINLILSGQTPREFTIELTPEKLEFSNSIYIDDDGNFVLTIQEEKVGDFLAKVIKIVINGNNLWESPNIDIGNSVEDVLIKEGDKYILAGHSLPYMLLTSIDLNGNIIRQDTFTHPSIVHQFTNAFVKFKNQYVLFTKGFDENDDVALYQYFINEDLSLDTIIVTDNGSNNQHTGVEINTDGNLIVVQSWETPPNQIHFYKMIEFSNATTSEVVWQSDTMTSLIIFNSEFAMAKNDDFFIPIGNFYDESDPFRFADEKGINAYTKEGEFKWRYAYSDLGFNITLSDIMTTMNGDVVCVGSTFEPSEGYYAWISRISADGDLLWERNYRKKKVGSRNEFQGHFSDVEELNDSTIVITGQVRQEDRIDSDGSRHRNDDIWVMLLDEDGCAYSGCDNFIITDTDETLSLADDELGINIFPNPSTGLFTFELEEEIINIQVYDFNGTLIKEIDVSTGGSQHSIDLRNEANGVYTVLFEGKNGKTQAERLIKLD